MCPHCNFCSPGPHLAYYRNDHHDQVQGRKHGKNNLFITHTYNSTIVLISEAGGHRRGFTWPWKEPSHRSSKKGFVLYHAGELDLLHADMSGAHILLLARGKDALEDAKVEVASHRKSSIQVIDAISSDLCDHLAVSPPVLID